MPIIRSAKKALRQNIRRRERNLKRLNEMRAVMKAYKKILMSGKKEGAEKTLSLVYKKLDKLVKAGVIKKNKASRLKSRLSKKPAASIRS